MSTLHDISEYVRSGETEKERLGLEIEHFVVDEKGTQITFQEITELIERVGRKAGARLAHVDGYTVGYANDKYAVSLEPSCQFEISINPYSSLKEIEEAYREFRSTWEPIFAEKGYHFVAKGNLPLVECDIITPDEIPLSPKKRYEFMDAYFRTSGKYGKYMMRASASTQVSIDYKSEADLIRKLRLLEKISPIVMIMMENKSRENTALPGAADKTHLLRIQEWEDLDPARTGFYPGSFEEDFGYEKIADVVYHTPLILMTENDTSIYVGPMTAQDLLAEHVLSEEGVDEERKIKRVEHFLSMGFFHFRIKKYIEIRVADSVPIEKALGYTAMLKGIVYSENNLDILERELTDINGLEEIQDAVQKIERDGEQAVIYHNMTAAQWAAFLIGLAGNALPAHEKRYLGYV
ncbi:MAG: hypothetical protein J6D46_02830, partial [Lachnospiraceae bacterium]|nr:hypothetical protein [Lachnospiraceae bacterium]